MAAEFHSNESDLDIADTSVFSLRHAAAESSAAERAQAHADETRRMGLTWRFRYFVVKRCIDIVLVLLASPLLLPLLLAVAMAVRLSSPGPIFFTHRRIRRHGEFFTMWKFRTMRVNSAELLDAYLAANPEARRDWQATRKLCNDPRVTRVGSFLRRSSLDELPQLWNVLNGSMTLVGPRPIVAAEVEKYGPYFPDYCKMKPGITGLWQVSGRSSTSYTHRVTLDRRYAREWSLLGDFVILLKTLFSVIRQDGAY
jgi:lipopolysaccharide/colanic/teichoic acid biosynthesis glycosyltransferase